MSNRPTSRQTILPSQSTMRPSSGLGLQTSNQSALQARINEKKLELESLRQLRDLSGGLAGQMQQLEDKLNTLSNGTEAVAAVMGNWNTVLRAIYMASQKIPKPKEDGEGAKEEEKRELPQTLVRIPIQQAEAVQREQEEKRRAEADTTVSERLFPKANTDSMFKELPGAIHRLERNIRMQRELRHSQARRARGERRMVYQFERIELRAGWEEETMHEMVM
ncbi:hypothetical protein PRZ48_012476 [Zasmidium cellare]|uniref:DASH complex subunit DAD2 n=1 Tax=Zasmidium cellare TaxID=395010 RepID=A0ABR0E5J6_ZASCE|nr:hypothetical protein PRZ48_012476 [Zasmidium cellare]